MQNLKTTKPQAAFIPQNFIPPLENGEHLTWKEFARRFDAMPNLKKAELIGGKVYMSSPVSNLHAEPHANVMTWLGNYRAMTPGTRFSDNATLRFDDENAPQPDAILWIDETHGGSVFLDKKDYLNGTPELIVEIAVSSASYDLHEKKQAYELQGIKEYVVWRVLDGAIDWFVLENEKYVSSPPDADGIVESTTFAGLRLNVEAMLAGDLHSVLMDLQKGLETKQHAEFVEKLAENTRT